MEVIKTEDEIRKKLYAECIQKKTIGFVPTMGFFHQGHLELIRKARQENDIVVVSIFINPIQFGPSEDFEQYPRDMERDIALAEKVGVDYIFAPPNTEIYPKEFKTNVKVNELDNFLCGGKRKGHFKGVTTVVAILFNIIKPDKAYFGAKDFQQMVIIAKMVKDLHYDIEIVSVPIFRENNGLAMSSRNIYLNEKERIAATIIYKSLEKAKELVKDGNRSAINIKEEIGKILSSEPLFQLEYLSICNPDDFQELEMIEKPALLALAGQIGQTRLIDNQILNP